MSYEDKLMGGIADELMPTRKKQRTATVIDGRTPTLESTEVPLDDLMDDFPPMPASLRRTRTVDSKAPTPIFNGARIDHVRMTSKQYDAWCKDVVDNMQRACDDHNVLVPQDTWRWFRRVWREEFTEGLMFNDSTHGELVPIEIEEE